jgi:hypothetical protein
MKASLQQEEKVKLHQCQCKLQPKTQQLQSFNLVSSWLLRAQIFHLWNSSVATAASVLGTTRGRSFLFLFANLHIHQSVDEISTSKRWGHIGGSQKNKPYQPLYKFLLNSRKRCYHSIHWVMLAGVKGKWKAHWTIFKMECAHHIYTQVINVIFKAE